MSTAEIVRKRVVGLHTAARRYCIDNISRWRDAYSQLRNGGRDGSGYTDEAYRVFPRYNVLGTILENVEMIVPDDFDSVDDLRAALLYVATWAEGKFTKNPSSTIAAETMRSERRDFADYIRQLDVTSLDDVLPLFHRRIFRREEAAAVWERVSARWQIGKSYWYPLSEKHPDIIIEAFNASTFGSAIGASALQNMLRSGGVRDVWMFGEGEWEHSYEIEVELFEPAYTGSEWFYTSDGLEWIVYVSHEDSITVGGWLLDKVKAAWPAWHTKPFQWWFEKSDGPPDHGSGRS